MIFYKIKTMYQHVLNNVYHFCYQWFYSTINVHVSKFKIIYTATYFFDFLFFGSALFEDFMITGDTQKYMNN